MELLREGGVAPPSAVGGTEVRQQSMMKVANALMGEIFGDQERLVAVARQWLYGWFEHHQLSLETGSVLLADLLYHMLICPTEIEITAYESSDTSRSLALQLLGPVDHASPRLFNLSIDCRSSQNLGLICLGLVTRYQQFFGEMTAGAGLCRSILFRRCVFDLQAEHFIDRIALCQAVFQLFLLGALKNGCFETSLETALCAMRYLRQRIEMRRSRVPVMERAHGLCLDMEGRLGDRMGVILWLAEFVASYAYVGPEETDC